MKKLVGILLAIALLGVMASCGSKETEMVLNDEVDLQAELEADEWFQSNVLDRRIDLEMIENATLEGVEPIVQAYYDECVKFQNMCASSYGTGKFCEAIMFDLNHDGVLELYLFYTADGVNYFSRAFEYKNGKTNMILNLDALENGWCSPMYFYAESAFAFRAHTGTEADGFVVLQPNSKGVFERFITNADYHDGIFTKCSNTGVGEIYSNKNEQIISEAEFDKFANNDLYHDDVTLFTLDCQLDELTPESFIDYFEYCMEVL